MSNFISVKTDKHEQMIVNASRIVKIFPSEENGKCIIYFDYPNPNPETKDEEEDNALIVHNSFDELANMLSVIFSKI